MHTNKKTVRITEIKCLTLKHFTHVVLRLVIFILLLFFVVLFSSCETRHQGLLDSSPVEHSWLVCYTAVFSVVTQRSSPLASYQFPKTVPSSKKNACQHFFFVCNGLVT